MDKTGSGTRKMYDWGRTACRVAASLILLGMIVCVVFVRNPFMTRYVDAKTDSVSMDTYSDAYKRVHPYVRIDHADLAFTGYYSVDSHDQVYAYYFFGQIGKYGYFVEIPPERAGSSISEGIGSLEGYSFTASLSEGHSLIDEVAGLEGISTEEYTDGYDISETVLLERSCDREKVIIYYGIALFSALLFWLIPGFWSYKKR